MRKTFSLIFFAAVLSGADPMADLGPSRIMSGATTLRKSGPTVYFASYAIPGGSWGSAYGTGGIGGTGEPDTISRSITEAGSGLVFGYDLAFTGDAANGYQAIFRPLSNTGGRPRAAVPKFPPPQAVRDGDTIAVDLMVSPDGSRRITDYIRIFSRPPEPPAATTNAVPRDFTIDDGPVIYDTFGMTVWTDGRKYDGIVGFAGKPGATFWIAFPGRGRYVLSLAPHEGFVKAGDVRDNVLSFQDGGQEYQVRFMSPVAGAGKAWNIYMRHDPGYEPKPALRDRVRCGSDRLDNLQF